MLQVAACSPLELLHCFHLHRTPGSLLTDIQTHLVHFVFDPTVARTQKSRDLHLTLTDSTVITVEGMDISGWYL